MGLQTRYFDCCAGFGYFEVSPLEPAIDVESLLKEMDDCGIERALVYHALQVDGSPVVGNKVVAEEVAGNDRLEISWAILPWETGEFPCPDDLIDAMSEAGVRALRAFPDNHRYLFTPGSLGELFEVLCERNIPLFIMLHSWEEVERVLSSFPDLTLVVCARHVWGDDRYFRPLLKKYSRLFIDTSRYELCGGLEDLVNKYGYDQIVFGTNYPYTPMGGPRLTLDGAKITESAREAIAHGNLERILSEAKLK